MNENYDLELLFNFYWKNLITDPKIFENHPLLGKRLMNLSDTYFFNQKKNQNHIDKILYKSLIPLDSSPENFLFLKFMKFHLGFLRFNQWYQPNDFNKLEVNELVMKDYLTKSLVVCLESNKRKIKEKLHLMTDFQIISNVCRRERITLYNFLQDFDSSANSKDFINSLYLKTYRGKVYKLNFSKETKQAVLDEILGVYSKNIINSNI